MASKRADWTRRAQDAMGYRLRPGIASRGALGRLRQHKVEVIAAMPKDATPLDTGLRSILSDQVEALGLVAAALDGRPYDGERLSELTMREAWRLKRTDILGASWGKHPQPNRGGSPD